MRLRTKELLKEGTTSLHTYIRLVRLDYTRRIDDDDDDGSSVRLFVCSSMRPRLLKRPLFCYVLRPRLRLRNRARIERAYMAFAERRSSSFIVADAGILTLE